MLSCNTGTWVFSYYETTVGSSLIIILQLWLFCLTVHYEYKKRNDEQYQKVSVLHRTLYLILQILGLCWTIGDLLRLVIDPYTFMLRGNFTCDMLAWIPKIIPIPYYIIYLYQLLLRLKSSFTDSYLQLSKISVYILNTLIFIPLIIAQIIFFPIIFTTNHPTCIGDWKPIDFNGDQLSFCALPMSPIAFVAISVMSVWITIMNIIIAVIFGAKLSKLLSKHDENTDIKFRFKSLIVKNCILTTVGAISTLMCYLLFSAMPRGPFLYTDLFVNCLVIGLMFKYNEKFYKRCCKCCILICFVNCDKSQEKVASSARRETVMEYINHNDEIDLTAIFNQNNHVSIANINSATSSPKASSIGDMIITVEDNTHQLNLDDVVAEFVDVIYSEGEGQYTKTKKSQTIGTDITSYNGSVHNTKIVELNMDYKQ